MPLPSAASAARSAATRCRAPRRSPCSTSCRRYAGAQRSSPRASARAWSASRPPAPTCAASARCWRSSCRRAPARRRTASPTPRASAGSCCSLAASTATSSGCSRRSRSRMTSSSAGWTSSRRALPADVGLQSIHKAYADVIAVDEIDLDVDSGEFFTLLGPSGSGKTTTLRIIAGFERPDGGAVRLGGADVTHTPPHKRDVNTVFQDYALFPHMTVAENVAYGLKVKGVDRAERTRRVDEVLERVRLDGYGRRKPIQLSGGQRQRVALARAIVNRPQVLLLDEPLGALDLKLRQEMQVFLKTLQRELGMTFLYVTHDQEEALTMSDHVAVFNEGRIEQVGTPTEIYQQPVTEFVAGFVGTSNILERG